MADDPKESGRGTRMVAFREAADELLAYQEASRRSDKTLSEWIRDTLREASALEIAGPVE